LSAIKNLAHPRCHLDGGDERLPSPQINGEGLERQQTLIEAEAKGESELSGSLERSPPQARNGGAGRGCHRLQSADKELTDSTRSQLEAIGKLVPAISPEWHVAESKKIEGW